MDKLKIAVLGKPEIKRAGQPLDLISAKGQALLIYLVVSRQVCSRSHLAGLLWGEMPEKTARTNLRLTLSKLRKAAGDHLIITRQEASFQFDKAYWLDVAEFESGASAPEQSEIEIEPLRAAVKLYRGDFLDDFYVRNAPAFEEWVLTERERLRLLALKALSHLAEAAQQRGDLAEGIELTRRILALEPWQEEAHRQLMRLLADSDQRSAALAQFDTCRRLLAEELGAEPAPATVKLYEQIKSGEQIISIPLLPGPPSPRHNLPPQLTPLLGREAELAQIAGLLARPDCRLLTLVGPGGIGKTRLALASAEAQFEAFRDGVSFVSLVGVTAARENEAAELLVVNVANALNYPFSAQRPPRELLLNHLATKELLLVLDNFEQLLSPPRTAKKGRAFPQGEMNGKVSPKEEISGAADLLVDILHHAPGVKLLVTSRERLSLGGEWLLDVEGLPYPPTLAKDSLAAYPAVRLFVQTAQRIKPDFDSAVEEMAVNRICQLVTGFPLGLELAASWVRALSCTEIVTRLEGDHSASVTTGLDILTTISSMVAERHQSMRLVLDYSWDLLSDEEQHAFRRLSIFQEGFELDATEQVAEVTLPVLAGLADKSWLRRDRDGRYRLHELVRQYGAEQLAAHSAEQVTMQQRHSRYYANLLEASRAPLEDGAPKWILIELDKEVENIRAAWEWLLGRGEIKEIASYLEGLWRYYRHKGRYQEMVFVLSRACALEKVSNWQEARWHRWLGEAFYHIGHFSESRNQCEQTMALIGQPLPTTKAGWTLTLLRQLLRQAVHRLWPAGFVGRSALEQSPLLEGSRAMARLTPLYYLAGDKLRTLSATLYDLNLAERAGASPELARGYSGMTLSCGSIPLHRLARLYGHLAHETVQHVSKLSTKVLVLGVTSIYNLGIGRWMEAEDALGRAAGLANRLELRRYWEEAWFLLAYVAYHQGQFTKGAKRFEEVVASAHQRSDTHTQHWGLVGQFECALRLGHIHADNVISFVERIIALPAEKLGNLEEIRSCGMLARAHLFEDKPQLAWQAAYKAAQLIEQSTLKVAWAMEGYADVAEVFLAVWEAKTVSDSRQGTRRILSILDLPGLKANNRNSEHQNLQANARQACRAMRKFARIFPIGRPRALCYQGLYYWLAGKQTKAQRAWHKSLAVAEQMEMPYEQSRAHYELGRNLPLNDPARRDHLTRACEIFTRLEATFDLGRAQDALQQTDSS